MNTDGALFGYDLFGEPVRQRKAGPLAERFEFPPFSVLDARAGEWQERKAAWLSLGIKSELGRTDCEVFAIGDKDKWAATKLSQRLAPGGGCWRGGPATNSSEKFGHHTAASQNAMSLAGGFSESHGSGTSVFDPVLTEMAYRWFSPEGAQVVDPFAGGSVRGIVAGLTGRKYWGCDLRPEQIAANEEQRAKICPEASVEWTCADAMDALAGAPAADLIFACPPYGDLEQYSDDPLDLSTMEYHTFIPALGRIVLRCAERLKNHRAAVFVVGDFRDKHTGLLRGFPGDVVTLFRNAGLNLYNEAILVTPCGSLPIRVGKQFASAKKLGKTHQNVLVFVKGDPKKAFAT